MSVTCVSASTPTPGRSDREWQAGCWLFSCVKQKAVAHSLCLQPSSLCFIFLKSQQLWGFLRMKLSPPLRSITVSSLNHIRCYSGFSGGVLYYDFMILYSSWSPHRNLTRKSFLLSFLIPRIHFVTAVKANANANALASSLQSVLKRSECKSDTWGKFGATVRAASSSFHLLI